MVRASASTAFAMTYPLCRYTTDELSGLSAIGWHGACKMDGTKPLPRC
jgi:hypothetical protein